jgi:hypothetical protein
MKYRYSIILVILTIVCFGPFMACAEGSRELNSSTGTYSYRVMFDFGYNFTGSIKNWYKLTAQDSISARNRFHVYANSGEVISFASSALGVRASGSIVGGSIFIYDPNGNLITSYSNPVGTLNDGLIAAGTGSKLRETQGPFGIYNSGVGGYTPLTYTVPAGGSGIYTIEFSSPAADITGATGGNYGSGSTCVPRANQDFLQMTGNNTTISAIDVSVFNSTLTTIYSGRVYTKSISLTGGQQQQNSGGACLVNIGGTSFRPYIAHNYTLYAVTREGLRYDITLRDLIGYGYLLYTDNVGIQLNDGLTPAYESIRYQGVSVTNRRVHNVTDPETTAETKHKVFFNIPDTLNMPATALEMGLLTWLDSKEVLSATYVDNLTFTSTSYASLFPLAGYFTFNFPNYNCGFYIDIDINGDGDYDDPEDVVLSGTTVVGLNTVNYDGRDGQGNYPVISATNCTRVRLRFNRSEIHVPLLDVEIFRGGLQLSRVNGHGTLPDYTLHYNDVPLADVTDLPLGSYMQSTPAGGINSSTFVHRWERTESNTNFPGYTGSPTHSVAYGDTRYIDNWAWDTLPTRYIPDFICGILNSKVHYFEANHSNNQVRFKWHIFLEGSDKAFLQKSNDGLHFTNIKEIRNLHHNEFISQEESIAYYRVMLITPQGVKTYSAVKKISLVKNKVVQVSPNPVNTTFVATIGDDTKLKRVVIYRPNGAIYKTIEANNNQSITVDASTWTNGIYLIQLMTNDHKIFWSKIYKN